MQRSFCVIGDWRIANGSLVVPMDGWNRAFPIIPTPQHAQATFDQIVSAPALPCPPRLVWLADAGGRGGFFSPADAAVARSAHHHLANAVLHETMSPACA